MNKSKITAVFFSLFLLFLITQPAHAFFIVDTGTPSGDFGWDLDAGIDSLPAQWLAAQFTTTRAYTITDISARFGQILGTEAPGTVTIALYSHDGLQVPGSTQLFSISLLVPAGSDGEFSWFGPSGLNWQIDPGTYWAAFEVRPGNTYAGRLQGGEAPPPHPLGDEAFSVGSTYFEFDDLDIALRIEDNVIPEPLTVLSLGYGLLGGLALRRKRLS